MSHEMRTRPSSITRPNEVIDRRIVRDRLNKNTKDVV